MPHLNVVYFKQIYLLLHCSCGFTQVHLPVLCINVIMAKRVNFEIFFFGGVPTIQVLNLFYFIYLF